VRVHCSSQYRRQSELNTKNAAITHVTHRLLQVITQSGLRATKFSVQFLVIILVMVAKINPATAETKFPNYRSGDPLASLPTEIPQGIVRLLADDDFAPWSYAGADGKQQGLTVELAREACAELRLACEIVPLPFAELLPALQRGEGDVIISGLVAAPRGFDGATPTRPILISTAGFYRHKDIAMPATDARSLTGKRIGLVRGSAHGTFLERHYAGSSLQPYATLEAMFLALRAKQLDVVFADTLAGSFWLHGNAAAGCCEKLGRPYLDRTTFSRTLFFLVRDERKNLRAVFDFALDHLEESGKTNSIFARYLPEPLW
jgi:polar amino acid transport system substrate-binding protein